MRRYINKKIHTLILTLGHETSPCVIYAPAKLEVATSNSLGGDAFTRKYICLTFDLDGDMKQCSVSSTLCEVCTCKV